MRGRRARLGLDENPPARAVGIALALLFVLSAVRGCDASSARMSTSAGATIDAASSAGSVRSSAQPAASSSGEGLGSAPAPSASAVARLSADGYPLNALETIPDDCKSPWVLLGSGAKDTKLGLHQWPWIEQAMRAHPQFESVAEAPGPGQIRFFEYDLHPNANRSFGGPPTVVLVGECVDGATCNRIAAMVEAVGRVGKITLECAEVPRNVLGRGRPLVLAEPLVDDDATKCARVALCRHMQDRSLAYSVHEMCLHSRFKFNLSCAERDGCEAVAECAKSVR